MSPWLFKNFCGLTLLEMWCLEGHCRTMVENSEGCHTYCMQVMLLFSESEWELGTGERYLDEL